jgi:hypothetical protein
MIQRFSVFSGTYDNAIDPRKDPEGDFCYWFDVEHLLTELSSLKAEREIEEDKKAALRAEVVELRTKIAKLKSLMLLTDPVVETYGMNGMTTEQWMEYIRCFPDEG